MNPYKEEFRGYIMMLRDAAEQIHIEAHKLPWYKWFYKAKLHAIVSALTEAHNVGVKQWVRLDSAEHKANQED